MYNDIMNRYYAVKKGRIPGIYFTWDECKAQVTNYSGAQYKKFSTKEEALEFIGSGESINEDLQENKIENIPPGTLIAYVDGSFDSSNGSYSYGAVLISSDKIDTYSKRFSKDKYSEHRNVIGEIRGSMFAIDYGIRNGFEKLYLHYDYEGIEKWATGAWKRNKEATELYYDFFQSIKDQIQVVFIKVKAHSGDKYNEMADKLAKEAVID